MELTLYTNPMSRGRIARWMCEELREAGGPDYETVLLDYGTTMKGPDYLAVNPMGKVPAIRHGDAVVTEAAAICAYLGDAFPDAGLAPGLTDPARAPYLRWLFFAAGPLEAAVTNGSFGWLKETPEERGRLGYGSMDQVVDALDGWLKGREFVVGDRFTAADVYVASAVGWGLMFKTLPERPSFAAYALPHQARPAAIRAREIDDALMPKEK